MVKKQNVYSNEKSSWYLHFVELLLNLEEAWPSEPQGFISLSLLLRRPWRGGLHPPPPPPPLAAALAPVSGGGKKINVKKPVGYVAKKSMPFFSPSCVCSHEHNPARSWTRLISKQAAASLLFGPPFDLAPTLTCRDPSIRPRSLSAWPLNSPPALVCVRSQGWDSVCVCVCVSLDRVCQWTRVGWWVDMIGFQLNLVKNKCNRYR